LKGRFRPVLQHGPLLTAMALRRDQPPSCPVVNSRLFFRKGDGFTMETFLICVAVAAVVLFSGFRVAQEYQRGVVFRLGRFHSVRGPGLYWIIPLTIERSVRIDIRTRTVSAEQQETITRDSVTVKLNAVLWYRVVDPERSVIAVTDAPAAVYQLALTSLRNIIGQHDLDEVLQERDKINGLLRESIVESTTPWGIEVERFEMKDVELPEAMQEVMAMQAEAIREKRARIIKAEAEMEASEKLALAAATMSQHAGALELRRFQMIAEVGTENNSTIVMMIPSDFVNLSNTVSNFLNNRQHEPVKA
jgi:regulator of protease activity HflC (stomatin/prohibitin superfamily)